MGLSNSYTRFDSVDDNGDIIVFTLPETDGATAFVCIFGKVATCSIPLLVPR
jgi:hypothetical protein